MGKVWERYEKSIGIFDKAYQKISSPFTNFSIFAGVKIIWKDNSGLWLSWLKHLNHNQVVPGPSPEGPQHKNGSIDVDPFFILCTF